MLCILMTLKKYLGGVGRGVLRFWGPRYRQPRSNLGHFWGFGGISGIEGVDIILWMVVDNQLTER